MESGVFGRKGRLVFGGIALAVGCLTYNADIKLSQKRVHLPGNN